MIAVKKKNTARKVRTCELGGKCVVAIASLQSDLPFFSSVTSRKIH
jgi:hypothetical protein